MPFVMGSPTASFPRTGRKIAQRARSSMRAPISGPWMNCASSRTTQTPLTDISMTDCMDQRVGRNSRTNGPRECAPDDKLRDTHQLHLIKMMGFAGSTHPTYYLC